MRFVLYGLPVECMFVLAGVLSDLDGLTFAEEGLALRLRRRWDRGVGGGGREGRVD